MGTLIPRLMLATSLIAFDNSASFAATGTDHPATTNLASDYLIAQAAEYSGDWKTASTLLASVWRRSHDSDTLRQAFLISLGAGCIDQALKLSAAIHQPMPEFAISTALLAADAIKRGDLTEATKLIDKLPAQGISAPLKTILGAWIDAAHGKRQPAIEALEGLKQFDTYRKLHTAMIDEFLGDRARADAAYAALETDKPQPRIASIIADYDRRTDRPRLADAAIAQLPATGNIAAISVRAELGYVRPKPTVIAGTAEAFYNMGELLLEADHPDIGLFYAAIGEYLDPAKPDTHLLLGEIEQAEGRHAQAAENFLAVPEKSDFGLLARLDATLALEESGHVEKAIATVEDLVKSRPALPEPAIELGDLLRRNKQYAKAIATYGHALDLLKPGDGEYADVIFARAIAYDHLHQDAKAETDLQRAVALAPDRPTFLNYLGFFWASRDEHLEGAHKLLDHAYALAPNDGAIADSLGWVLYQMGDYAGAVTHLEQAVSLMPGDSEINGHLGDAYWRVGRQNEARFQWRHALMNAEGSSVADFKARLIDGLAEPAPHKPAETENHAALDVKTAD